MLELETEKQLLAEVERSRSRLVAQAEDFGESLRSTLDPLKPIQRHPVGGVLASLAMGVMVGVLRSNGTNKHAAPQARSASRGMAMDLLWTALPLLAPVLQQVARRYSR